MTRNGHDTSFVRPSMGEEGDSVIQSNQELTLCLFFCFAIVTMGKQWKQWQILFSWAPKSL